jgi:MFS-type transporter involved in bile tolerance (Atg22 family)
MPDAGTTHDQLAMLGGFAVPYFDDKKMDKEDWAIVIGVVILIIVLIYLYMQRRKERRL